MRQILLHLLLHPNQRTDKGVSEPVLLKDIKEWESRMSGLKRWSSLTALDSQFLREMD